MPRSSPNSATSDGPDEYPGGVSRSARVASVTDQYRGDDRNGSQPATEPSAAPFGGLRIDFSGDTGAVPLANAIGPLSLIDAEPITGSPATQAERRVRLFKNGRSQAVRIPREFELPGKEAIMRKEGERLIIEPAPKRSLIELLDSLDPIDEEFPPIEDMPPEPVDL